MHRHLWFLLCCFSTSQGLQAQSASIPMRMDTCLNCKGSGINPNFCRVCNGTGKHGIKRVNEICRACAGRGEGCHYCGGTGRKANLYPEICFACAGGRPYLCPYCEQGMAEITAICKKQLKKNVPLWNHLGCLEDIFFIGNAVIDDTYTIEKHRIIRTNNSSLERQNRKNTSVSYGKDKIFSKTYGMIGMMDYEDDYVLIGGYSIPDSIIIVHIHEPKMQRFLHKDQEPVGQRHSYKTIWVNDSTFKIEMTYMVTLNHIICGHEEYFFENGILTKKLSHGNVMYYQYLEFDLKGNWTSRIKYTDTIENGIKQTRTIKYF